MGFSADNKAERKKERWIFNVFAISALQYFLLQGFKGSDGKRHLMNPEQAS